MTAEKRSTIIQCNRQGKHKLSVESAGKRDVAQGIRNEAGTSSDAAKELSDLLASHNIPLKKIANPN